MQSRIIYAALSILLLWINLSATQVNNPFARFASAMRVGSDSTVQEKVHLHLDKPYYVAGDNIWFKAYVLEEHTLGPSTTSSVLYVELARGDKVVQGLKLPIENGVTWGDFKLSDSIPQGSYRIRAYTQWMRNAGEKYFFNHNLSIGNKIGLQEKEKQQEDKSFEVQFFPEGGQLVKGIPTKVAVRATSTDGSGWKVEGTLRDPNGEPISFTTNDMGLGHFIITPSSTEVLKATIILSDGSKKDYVLPQTVDSGYSLMLRANGSLQIYMTADNLNKGTLSLVGQRNGNVYFTMSIPTTKQMASIIIPSDKLPSGILQVDLLDSNGSRLCERFTFVNHKHDKLDMTINGLKESYGKRSPVHLVIDAKQQEIPVAGSFSVSVTNSSVVSPDLDHESNILASFLLNSDATSPIERANRYINENRQQDIDLLMLTKSWRHIPWKSRTDSPAFAPELTMKISGTLTNNGKPLPYGKITLAKSIGGFDMLNTITDSKGRFSFDSLSFGDSTKLLLQARTAGDKKNVKILIDHVPDQEISIADRPHNNTDISVKLIAYVRQSEKYYEEQAKRISFSGTTQLKEVEITGNRAARDNNFVRRHGKADEEFTSKDLDSATFLSTVLFGKIRGNYRDYDVLLDGVFLRDDELEFFFLATEPSSLERIESLSSPHLLATYKSLQRKRRYFLIVTSKRVPKFGAVKYAPGVTTLTARGFSHTRTFQSPDHGSGNDLRPDLRPTVYWNPNIQTDGDGKLQIRYFNADQPGKYRIVIEGIGGNRGLARKEIYYEVK